MERQRQTLTELLASLSEIAVAEPGRDSLYGQVEQLLKDITDKTSYSRDELQGLLELDFKAGSASTSCGSR